MISVQEIQLCKQLKRLNYVNNSLIKNGNDKNGNFTIIIIVAIITTTIETSVRKIWVTNNLANSAYPLNMVFHGEKLYRAKSSSLRLHNHNSKKNTVTISLINIILFFGK